MSAPTTRRARTARTARLAAAGLTAAGLMAAGITTATAATALCGPIDLAPTGSGAYNVQNNNYGGHGAQCVTPTRDGFTVDVADGAIAPGGPPKSYPALVDGCHWGRCSTSTALPVRAADVGRARTAVTIETITSGSWNAAYDLWLHPSRETPGQATGTEIMLWINGRDAPSPIGQKVGTFDAAGASWTVWQGNIGWDVVSFIRDTPATSVDVPLAPFIDESIRRGATEPGDWLTSVQFGFEPWAGGAGLAASGFRVTGVGEPVVTGPMSVVPRPDPKPTTTTTKPEPKPAPAASSGRVGTLVGAGSGRCVDVAGRSTKPGAPVQLWDCQDGNAGQQWHRHGATLVNAGSGLCLDVARASTQRGAVVQQWTCDDDAPGQQWQADGAAVVNPASGLCLDARGNDDANATPLVTWDCHDGANQQWTPTT